MEQLKTHIKKRDELLEYLGSNFDMFNDRSVEAIKMITEYIHTEDKTMRDLVFKLNTRIKFNEDVKESMSHIELSMHKAKTFYIQRKVYEDYEKDSVADKWLVNAMVLIITKCFLFNGQVFTKGNKTILAADVLKGKIKEIDIRTLKYDAL